MGGVVLVLVPLVGPGFSWFPAKWFKVVGGAMGFGFLGLTCALITAAEVRVVSVRNGHSEWAVKAKGTIISVSVAVIVLAPAGAVTRFLVEKFAHITP